MTVTVTVLRARLMTTSIALFDKEHRHVLGVVMVLTSGMVFSTSGLMLRLMEQAGGWQVLFYRSSLFCLAMFLVIAFRYRERMVGAFAEIGWRGILAAVCMSGGVVLFIWAKLYTTIANALFIAGMIPFCAALLAYLILGERVHRLSWLTMAAALGGIVIMVAGGIVGGRLTGNLLAIIGAVSFAGFIVAIRRRPMADMAPVVCLGAAFAALYSAIGAESFAMTAHDLGICVFMGASLFVGFLLFTNGARYIRAGETSLLADIEIIIGPLWVWIFINEIPSVPTLAGGVIIILAILAQAAISARYPPPR